MSGIVGILAGTSERASRDVGIPVIEKSDLDKWLHNQVTKLLAHDMSDEDQFQIASYVRALQGNTRNLKIANSNEGYLNFSEVKKMVENNTCDEYILVQDAAIHNYEKDNACKIVLNNNVLCTDVSIPGILDSDQFDWPDFDYNEPNWFYSRTLAGAVIDAIADAWDCSVKEVYEKSNFSTDDQNYSAYIGKTGDEEIIMDHVKIIKRSKKQLS